MFASISQGTVTCRTSRSRLFVTRHEARQTVQVLRSAAGTIAVHDGAVSVVDAIATAAEHIAPRNAALVAMYARSALVGHAGVNLDAHGGYTVPALLAWPATVDVAATMLRAAAERLQAAVRDAVVAPSAGKIFEVAA